MYYIGSKRLLSGRIRNEIEKFSKENISNQFFDVFSGAGHMAREFQNAGYDVTSNDSLFVSSVINHAQLNPNPFGDDLQSVLDRLNSLPLPQDGFVHKNYCTDRMYFSPRNGLFCDAVREEIERSYHGDEKIYLLASLIIAMDKRSNTTGVYGAYLKHFQKSALKDAYLEPVDCMVEGLRGKTENLNAHDFVQKCSKGIFYLDPPYNSRQYISNYHVLETIALYDNPELKFKTGVRSDSPKYRSDFCSKRHAHEAMSSLLNLIPGGVIAVSYNNEGIISRDEMVSMLEQYGDVHVCEWVYRRYKSNHNGANRPSTVEYLFLVYKG